MYRRLGGHQDQFGRVRKISPAPGFDPRTVQPVASRYTDCAIPANQLSMFVFVEVPYVVSDGHVIPSSDTNVTRETVTRKS